MLLDLLLYSDFLEGSNKSIDPANHSVYCDTFSNLLTASVHPGNNIQAFDSILEKFEYIVSKLGQSGLGMMCVIWQTLANSACKVEKLSDQSSATTTSFGTVLRILKFPVQYLHVKAEWLIGSILIN